MTEIFLLKVQDASVVKEIVEKYPNTPAFSFIQNTVLKLDWSSSFDTTYGSLFLYGHWREAEEMIDAAVRLNVASRVQLNALQ